MSGEVAAAEEVPWPLKRVGFDEVFTVTEKIDGSRVGLHIVRVSSDSREEQRGVRAEVDGQRWLLRPFSPIRWLDGERDNWGFAAWVRSCAGALVRLRAGWHFGVWYGQGIARGYGLDHRRLALYDAERWCQVPDGYLPERVGYVPILARARGLELSGAVERARCRLEREGSLAVPGHPAEGLEVTPFNLQTVQFKVVLDPH